MPSSVPTQLLDATRTHQPGVFVVGCLARPLTIYSQQVRALNLVWALFQHQDLTPHSKVCIVGGGIAGITAAAALARLGIRCTLVEERQSVLRLQAANHTRYVHPRILDWPAEASGNADAGLPLLNWHAGIVSEVIKSLEKDWAHFSGMVDPLYAQRCVRISRRRAGVIVEVNANSDREKGPFDVCLLCVGFGVDGVPGPYGHGYWNNDCLDDHCAADRPTKWLVSGLGDGGLVDALRLTLSGFRNGEPLLDILCSKECEPLRRAIADIEASAEDQARATAASDDAKEMLDARAMVLTQAYEHLQIPQVLARRIDSMRRIDTDVTLNGRPSSHHNGPGAVFNRFLVHLALRGRMMKYIPGRVCPIVAAPLTEDVAGLRVNVLRPLYDATFTNYGKAEVHQFHGVVIRHGVLGPRVADLGLPDDDIARLKSAPESVARVLATPQWEPSFYHQGGHGAIDQRPHDERRRTIFTRFHKQVSKFANLLHLTDTSFAPGTRIWTGDSNTSTTMSCFVKTEAGDLGFLMMRPPATGESVEPVGRKAIPVMASGDADKQVQVGEVLPKNIRSTAGDGSDQIVFAKLPTGYADEGQLREANNSAGIRGIADVSRLAIGTALKKISKWTRPTIGKISGVMQIATTVAGERRTYDALEATAEDEFGFAQSGDAGAPVATSDDLLAGVIVARGTILDRGYIIPIDKIMRAIGCKILT